MLFLSVVMVRVSQLSFASAVTAVSGLSYFLPYFLVAPSAEQRYAYWPILAATVSIVVSTGLVLECFLDEKRA